MAPVASGLTQAPAEASVWNRRGLRFLDEPYRERRTLRGPPDSIGRFLQRLDRFLAISCIPSRNTKVVVRIRKVRCKFDSTRERCDGCGQVPLLTLNKAEQIERLSRGRRVPQCKIQRWRVHWQGRLVRVLASPHL